ncbi:MAG: sigma-70 family RNA polymerase sigma factor [Acidimicrobiia bacterium]|nr:sigma-70 family RNA polymerase sigma factor [Acidimicrobiia bacterium]
MTETSVAELLAAAENGSQEAWDALVDRYGRLVWSVVRGFRFDSATAADVSQTVWLRLVEHCGRIRDPERLPSWLATTARNEAIRATRRLARAVPTEFSVEVADDAAPPLDERLLEDEQLSTVLAAFEQMAPKCQDLLRLLCTDPPLDYEAISGILDMPIGSIGPTRSRCLERLRRHLETQ